MVFLVPHQPVGEQRQELGFQRVSGILRLAQNVGNECGQMQQEVAFAVADLQGFFGEDCAAAPGEIEMGDQRFAEQLRGEADGIGGVRAEKRLELFVVQVLCGAEPFQRAAALQGTPLPPAQAGGVVPSGEEGGAPRPARIVIRRRCG